MWKIFEIKCVKFVVFCILHILQMFTSTNVDANRATSISLALRKIVVLLCHHLITSNSQSENSCSSFLSLSQKRPLFLVMYGTSFVSCELIALFFLHFLGPIHSLNANDFFFFSFTSIGVEFWDAHVYRLRNS